MNQKKVKALRRSARNAVRGRIDQQNIPYKTFESDDFQAKMRKDEKKLYKLTKGLING